MARHRKHKTSTWRVPGSVFGVGLVLVTGLQVGAAANTGHHDKINMLSAPASRYENGEAPGSVAYLTLQSTLNQAAKDLNTAGMSWASFTQPVEVSYCVFSDGTDGDETAGTRIHLNPSTSNPVATLLHETGHAFDWTTGNEHGGAALREALARTPEIKRIQAELNNPAAEASHGWDEYALDPQEIWARAFSQYVAGAAQDMAAYESLIHSYGDQWTPRDFGVVATGLNALLKGQS